MRAATVLALNSGSSSLKFGLYRVDPSGGETLLSGKADSIGAADSRFRAAGADGAAVASEATPVASQQDAMARLERLLDEAGFAAPAAIGHRIVHGGPTLRQHCLIDDGVLRALETASVFAPVHTPPALSVIRLAQAHFPGRPQVACFDTTFHADLPEVAQTLPIPADLRALGLRRYGFHGLSCESILRQLGPAPPARVVVAHLGSGASVTAVLHGKSVDTSMGLTPTGGVIMSSRSGDLDPGVLIYLAREHGYDAAMLEALVDHRSGLLGISGVAGDLRRLHEAAASNADARLAIAMFGYSVRKQIAGMAAALGGLDLLVFTGGIGENDSLIRASICDGLSWLGASLDGARNVAAENPISDAGSRCVVRVLASQEDEQIARHTWALTASLQDEESDAGAEHDERG